MFFLKYKSDHTISLYLIHFNGSFSLLGWSPNLLWKHQGSLWPSFCLPYYLLVVSRSGPHSLLPSALCTCHSLVLYNTLFPTFMWLILKPNHPSGFSKGIITTLGRLFLLYIPTAPCQSTFHTVWKASWEQWLGTPLYFQHLAQYVSPIHNTCSTQLQINVHDSNHLQWWVNSSSGPT